MRIWCIGADGMLGQEVVNRLVNHPDDEVIATTVEELDICNREAVFSIVKRENVDYIINCAAITDVDGCETQKDLACQVNGIAVKNLAEAANEVNAVLIQISTDYVFNGELPYDKSHSETDEINPKTAYGYSKMLGEKNAAIARKYYILRTAWLYGKNGKKHFINAMLNQTNSVCKTVKVVCDQYGSPTSTAVLTDIIVNIMEQKIPYGIYHASCRCKTNWFAFARAIFDLTGHSEMQVLPVTTEQYKELFQTGDKVVAPRPKNSYMTHAKLRQYGIEIPVWYDALKAYFE